MLQTEDIQALTGFGLTFLQAKVYLTLVKTGKSTIRNIAEAANLARQEVQRVTIELQSLGLVEKILVNPTEFNPVPINEAILFLRERRDKASVELEERANKLLTTFENSKPEIRQEETRFVMTTGKEVIIKKSRGIVNRTMKSCDIINGCWKSIGYASSIYKEQNVQALKRHIRIRIIAERLPDEQSVQEIYKHSIENPFFEIRFIPYPMPVALGIYDKKELILFTSPQKLIGDSPMLWTNNPALIVAVQTYFDKVWRQSRSPKIRNLQNRRKRILPAVQTAI